LLVSPNNYDILKYRTMDAYVPITVEQSKDGEVFTASCQTGVELETQGASDYEAVQRLYPLLRSSVQGTKTEEFFLEPDEGENKQRYLRISMFSEGERLIMVLLTGSFLALIYSLIVAWFLNGYYYDPDFHSELTIDLVFDSIYPAFSRLVPWLMVLFILLWSFFYRILYLPLSEGYARVLFRIPFVKTLHKIFIYLPGSVVDALNISDKPPFLVLNHYISQKVNGEYNLLPRVKSMRFQNKNWPGLLKSLQKKVYSQFQIILNPIGKTANMSPYTLELYIPVDRSQLNIRDGIYFYGIFIINAIIITNYYFFSGGVFGIDASASFYNFLQGFFPGIEQVYHSLNMYLWLLVNTFLGTVVLFYLYLPAIYIFGWLPSRVLRILVGKIYTLK